MRCRSVAAVAGVLAIVTLTHGQATIQQAIQEADSQSRFLAETGGSAGYDNGFFIRQGDFVLKPGLHLQVRNVTDIRQNAKNDDATSTTNGFELRRARIDFAGNAFTPDLSYYLQIEFSRSTGAGSILDAWAKYKAAPACAIRAGQFKLPPFHEEIVSDKIQLAVERSLLNATLGGGLTERVQGISLIYGDYRPDQPAYFELVVHDGARSFNTDFTDAATNWGLAGRMELKLMGDWKNYQSFAARNLTADLVVLGAGADVSQGDGFTQYLMTVDGQYGNTSGLGAYAAGLGRMVDTRNALGDESTFDWGLLLQASYELSPQWQVFARWDWVHFENQQLNGQRNMHELTVGVSHYLTAAAGPRAKVTVDLGYLPNGAPAPFLGQGVQGGTGDNEIYLRAQLNLAI